MRCIPSNTRWNMLGKVIINIISTAKLTIAADRAYDFNGVSNGILPAIEAVLIGVVCPIKGWQ